MTVSELIEKLQTMPQDAVVFVQAETANEWPNGEASEVSEGLDGGVVWISV